MIYRRNLFSVVPALLSLLFLSTSCGRGEGCKSGGYSHLYEGLEFEMPVVDVPQIPSREVSLVDFGGVGDGVTLNTDAFAKAIAHLSEEGGGRLVVPSGIWFTGPVELKSSIDLHLTENAVILFSPDRALYPIIETDFEGLPTRRCESPIHAENAANVAITGLGTIDGNGAYWRPLKKSKVVSSQWKQQISKGGYVGEDEVWYPDESYLIGMNLSDKNLNVPRGEFSDAQWEEMKSFLRPVMISFRNCENVFLEGVTFPNSPFWNIHPLLCRNVVIDGIKVRNPSYSQNGDGIDIDACENVILVNSSFDVGDDGICIKSGKDAPGRDRGIPCRNLLIDNCVVFHGHGGFVVGSEMSGGVENIKVSNCRFLGTDVGLRFKSKRGRGGIVRNIYIDNMYMTDIATETILFDLFYGGVSAVEAAEAKANGKSEQPVQMEEVPAVDETTPQFRDIYISNVVCNGAARAMYFNGLPEMPVENINISNCVISSVRGIEINRSKDVTLKNVKVHPSKGESVAVNNVENFRNE